MNKIKYTIYLFFFFCTAIAQTPNSWTRVADFPDTARTAAVAFSIDSFGYVCLGGLVNVGTGGYIYPNGLWQYNPYTDVWTKKASFPSDGRGDARCFVIGSKAYIGLGDQDGAGYNDFWEYDPATDTWTKKANFPGGGRVSPIAFSIGTMGYAGLGYSDTAAGSLKDFWQYDPATDTWTQKNDFLGIARAGASAFSIGGSGFVALGYDQDYGLNGLYLNDLWQYDTASDSWAQKANYPGKADGATFSFTIGDIAYLGTGVDSTNKCYNDFWKYDPQIDTWTEKDSFGGGIRLGAVAFSIGNWGYAGGGDTPNVVCLNDFWMYTPDSISTGIRSIDESSISIYPDPVSGQIIINNIAPNTPIIITDMLGQVMMKEIAETTKMSVDVSSLPPGVYCVNNVKFVKE